MARRERWAGDVIRNGEQINAGKIVGEELCWKSAIRMNDMDRILKFILWKEVIGM
jgi:hypothetical protein